LVNSIDEISEPIDHIGWRLWRLTQLWKAEFDAAMVAEGYPWFSDARSNLLGHVPPQGCRQSDLVARSGISKQGVQQMLLDLEALDIIERQIDPDDRRNRIILYSAKGHAVRRSANAVKRRLHAHFASTLGMVDFDQLAALLETAHERLQQRATDSGNPAIEV
jgi:DNA-binding MarR family transcriptional regulator